ncbi:10003_t:CDS:2, partial [Acaulospora morrowiae]
DGDVLMNLVDQQINDDLKTVIIEFFWEELVSKAKIDRSILAYMIKDIREDVIIELLAYGFVVLKRCTELVSDIEEVFRALLIPLSDDKKLEFCVELLEQVEKIQDEFKGDSNPNYSDLDTDRVDVYVSSIMSRVKLLVLGTHVLTGRVNAVVTSNNLEIAHKNKEYMLIFKWVIILVSLLCEQRIHRDGGGVAHFELLLDLVSFLLDEMGKNARAIFVAELKNYKFEIPSIWSNRIKRVLPFTFNPETVGEGKKHVIDPWLKIECLGE